MKKLFNLFNILIVAMLFTSCSSYINRMYREFDKADNKNRVKPRYDKFDMYRRRPVANKYSTRNRRNMRPAVKRQYTESSDHRRRYKSEDLYDNSSDGSLWVKDQGDNSLFATANKKMNGDIVLVNVFNKLKNEISAELKRAFPAPKKKAKKGDKKGEKTAEAPAPAPQADSPSSPGSAQDRISTVVVEEINRDHLLIRGRKYLLYRNRKRMIELQALVSRRDINATDEIDSNKILESNIAVVR